MKRLLSWSGVLVFAAAVLLPASLRAANFVFTNNDLAGANSVTAFSVDSTTFALTNLGTTPTGGTGCGGGLYASNRIITSPSGNYLYVANGGSNTITVFKVNQTTGALTAAGSPVPTGGTACNGSTNGMSLAINQDDKFLYAASAISYNITTFSVGKNGTLTALGSPLTLPDSPDGIKVRPDGKFLAVAFYETANLESYDNQIGMYSIGKNGALTAVPGSPFPTGGTYGEAGVDFQCGEKVLFGGEVSPNVNVDVFGVGKTGALTPVPGSPFTYTGASNSNVVVWNSFGQMLFVSNQSSSSVTDFIVGPKGNLTPGANQPTSLGSAGPSGMAVNTIRTPALTTVTLLYVVDYFYQQVFVFTVAIDGTLSAVSGSPFATTAGGVPLSIAAIPSGDCP